MTNKIFILLTGILIVAAFALLPVLFAQTFDLAYSLTDGGSQSMMELTPNYAYKGITLTVNSVPSQPYEIIQKVIRPLESRNNPGNAIRQEFVVRSLSGTNRPESYLRILSNDMPVRPDGIIYKSDKAGNSDSFTLIYGISNFNNILPGYYEGQIGFTLRPISGGRQEDTHYLSVRVIVGAGPESKPSIEITSATGGKTIALSSKRPENQSADVLVKIKGNFKKVFTITQYLPRQIESKEGLLLGFDAVNFVVKEARKGVAVNQNTPLSVGMQNVYMSAPSGEADAEFVITYSLANALKQKAGSYRANIQYMLDAMGVQTKLDTLSLEIENERVFDLVVKPQDQKGSIEFANLKPSDQSRKNEVILQVNSNAGKPYQVTQKVNSDLVNKEGNILPPERFTVHTESMDTLGALKFTSSAQVPKGDSTLLISDNEGSPTQFKVVYELSVPAVIKGGEYSASVIYSLSEL